MGRPCRRRPLSVSGCPTTSARLRRGRAGAREVSRESLEVGRESQVTERFSRWVEQLAATARRSASAVSMRWSGLATIRSRTAYGQGAEPFGRERRFGPRSGSRARGSFVSGRPASIRRSVDPDSNRDTTIQCGRDPADCAARRGVWRCRIAAPRQRANRPRSRPASRRRGDPRQACLRAGARTRPVSRGVATRPTIASLRSRGASRSRASRWLLVAA